MTYPDVVYKVATAAILIQTMGVQRVFSLEKIFKQLQSTRKLHIFFKSIRELCWTFSIIKVSQEIVSHLDNLPNLTPEKYASFISKTVFGWFDGIAIIGWKRLLKDVDLWSLRKEDRCAGIVPVWDKHWKSHEEKAKSKATTTKQKKAKLSIVWPLIYSFGPAYAISAFYQLGYR